MASRAGAPVVGHRGNRSDHHSIPSIFDLPVLFYDPERRAKDFTIAPAITTPQRNSPNQEIASLDDGVSSIMSGNDSTTYTKMPVSETEV